jgi:uncharacterized membrane protein YkvA (DUF1232 family)
VQPSPDDYGQFSVEQRRVLMQTNSLSVDRTLLQDSHLIIVDDLKVTGAHQDCLMDATNGLPLLSRTFLHIAKFFIRFPAALDLVPVVSAPGRADSHLPAARKEEMMFRAQVTWQHLVRSLKRDVVAIALAVRDPRVPWYAKAVGVCVIAYALSPIDLIPDFVPVLGLLDDLVLVPLGLLLVVRLIPADILTQHRAAATAIAERPVSWAGAAVVIAIWALAAALLAALVARAIIIQH